MTGDVKMSAWEFINTWRMNVKDVLKNVEGFGFKQVLDIPFLNDENKQEHMYIYFHYIYGILLEFDTYGGDHVNGGHYYYQWVTKTGQPGEGRGFSSGGWEKVGDKYIWEGHGDCREGMLESIGMLAYDGKFVTPWIKTTGIFAPRFVHWMDHHAPRGASWNEGYEMYEKALREKTPERFKMLPEDVQCAIGQNMRTPIEKE